MSPHPRLLPSPGSLAKNLGGPSLPPSSSLLAQQQQQQHPTSPLPLFGGGEKSEVNPGECVGNVLPWQEREGEEGGSALLPFPPADPATVG